MAGRAEHQMVTSFNIPEEAVEALQNGNTVRMTSGDLTNKNHRRSILLEPGEDTGEATFVIEDG